MAWAWPVSGEFSAMPTSQYTAGPAAAASAHATAANHAASTARIAEILRSRDPWPKPDPMTPLELAHQLVSQHRNLVSQGSVGSQPGVQQSVLLAGPDLSGSSQPAALLQSGAFSGDPKAVAQLAERVSLLLAGLQQQYSAEKQDVERQLVQIDSRVDTRVSSLEARVAACEEQVAGRERNDSKNAASETATALREARALVGGAVTEVQARWHEDRTELMEGQQEQARQLEEVAAHAKSQAQRLQEISEHAENQAHCTKQLEETLQTLLERQEQPPWYGELESAVARLEYRVEEHRSATELALGRFRSDVDGMRMRLESLREDALCTVDSRIDQELERLLPVRHVDASPMEVHRKDKDISRRLDDMEARLAAIRVRSDSHDSRLATVAERAEAACQQALDGARQAASAHREDILSEVDCQLRIVRQRVEAVGELCEELSLRQIYKASSRWSANAGEAETDDRDEGRPSLLHMHAPTKFK